MTKNSEHLPNKRIKCPPSRHVHFHHHGNCFASNKNLYNILQKKKNKHLIKNSSFIQ